MPAAGTLASDGLARAEEKEEEEAGVDDSSPSS
jgi:hypothetical protein